ncbi:MAG: bifunctional DNA-formamidopyrimidine glycosylase/DNA-(apurinic or apyrimidinic site) lyase [Pirellulales bacterium]|nr:bifunctional DNA-formamidopyrimidine glycosylase/DNA-(apurinic or apyrimidinic site) lyase [Pirellulales bacterium]
MPELPEVETMRRGVAVVTGSTIEMVQLVPCDCKPIRVEPKIKTFQRRAVGRRVHEVGRVGKRVLLQLDSGDSIVFEPRMTGLVLVTDPPNIDHLRFRVALSGCRVRELWYWDRRGLGSVRLLSPRQLEEQFGPHKLGPDALLIEWESLRGRLKQSRRAIKVALLDQRIVAGIGNLYASEILHLAGIHPAQGCHRLTRQQWQAIHAAIGEILHTAIRYEGSTLSDGTYRNALNQSGGYQNEHRVYDRAGDTCPRCAQATIRRIVQAQRSTFFCPHCQSRRARRG